MSDAMVDPAQFRQVLGHFPTGVTVITAIADGRPAGLAVGSFASLSLDPPLVLFCPAKTSSSWPTIVSAGHFCVNILAEDQGDVCGVFASKTEDKFADISWDTRSTGAPVLENVLAWIDCEIHVNRVAVGGYRRRHAVAGTIPARS